MVTIGPKMTSHGQEWYHCDGCEQTIPRGSQMLAVQHSDGTPAGWHCEDCVRKYEQWGRFDPQRAEDEAKAT